MTSSLILQFAGLGFILAALLAIPFARRVDHAIDVDELDRHFRSTPTVNRKGHSS
ncbi:hypothetical protein [Gordonia sp. (in: high G+C Gram-positive bacteria)]|uniref:hypothetical protein n=1 Tax=Gordonia sp. (in: high G+C Gram-positive bacteria) TaxID=84139 RepID=UPI0039E6B8F0